MSEPDDRRTQHLDEMTCLLYIERQMDRERAQAVSAHTQDCGDCRTLLRAMERESRLLTRAMLEEDEALPMSKRDLERWWQRRQVELLSRLGRMG